MKRMGSAIRARSAAARARLRARLRAVSSRYRLRRILTTTAGGVLLLLFLLTFGHERRVAEVTRAAALGQPEACQLAVERCERYLRRVGTPVRLLGRTCDVECPGDAPGSEAAP